MFLALFFCASILGRSDAVDLDIEAWRWSLSLDSNLTLATSVDRISKALNFSLKLNVTTSNETTVHGLRVGISPDSKIVNGTHFGMVLWETEKQNSTNGTWTEYFTVNTTDIPKNESQNDWEFEFQSYYPEDTRKTWYEIDVSLNRSFGVKDVSLGREIKDEKIYLIWGYGIMNVSSSTLVNATEGSMEVNLLKFQVPGSATLSQPITTILLFGTAIFSVLFSANFCN